MDLKKLVLGLAIVSLFTFGLSSCDGEDGRDGIDGVNGQDGQDGQDGEDGEDLTVDATIFENKSSLEPLVAIAPQFSFVKAYSLISSTDELSNGFRLVGAQDGAGFLKDGDGYMYVVNAEDDYAVARIRFDEYMNPIEGDWLLNSGVADFARQCSGTMWEADIHGGSTDLFLSASESFNYDVKGIDPYIQTPTPTADFGLDALGEFAWENAVPLPRDTYSGKTVIIGGDDDSSGSEGQITLYYSENGDADLTGGKIYVLRLLQVSDGVGGVVDVAPATIYNESNLDFGVTYDFEFVEIPEGASLTKNEMEDACVGVFATAFMRVEDVDYQKGSADNARNIFVAVTGRGPGRGTYNDWGTVYKMELDEDAPFTGKITQIISGNTDTNNMDGNLPELQSPDNICVTENFVYTQEDPNSFDRGHAAYIYQSDLNGNNTRVVLEMIVRNDLDPTGSTGFSGEFGALIDISDKIGEPNTFLLNLQPHYWESDDFKGVDGHDMETNAEAIMAGAREDDQGGQIVILKGLPR
ncbi:PhoX family protein [Flagellimonas meishanensis]|uniref:PhoX family protein n=1 Tax=Flagellimonas meishanensis TaxID=2873264 RepID=UPI001CA741FC|nr:PhoX family protein [[Muricauda] meishanensis]